LPYPIPKIIKKKVKAIRSEENYNSIAL